jgi:hypothetical protein
VRQRQQCCAQLEAVEINTAAVARAQVNEHCLRGVPGERSMRPRWEVALCLAPDLMLAGQEQDGSAREGVLQQARTQKQTTTTR